MSEDTVQLSETATAALRELAISGPGIPGPEEWHELVAHGLAARVLKITPEGEAVARTIPGFLRAQLEYALAKAREVVGDMEQSASALDVPPQETQPGVSK